MLLIKIEFVGGPPQKLKTKTNKITRLSVMTSEDGASEIQERYARGPKQRRKHETSREHLINESSRMYTFAIARACKVAIVLIDSKEDGRSRSET